MIDDISQDAKLYEIIKEDLNQMTEEEKKEFISILLDDYELRKKQKRLYEVNGEVPKIIIKSYYECIDDPQFDTLVSNFRRKYILNENKVESVHEKEEREGLGVVYEFVQDFSNLNNLNVYTLLTLHQLLYSKCPYPEAGGKFRPDNRYLPGSGTDITNYDLIPYEMQKLYLPVQELIKEGINIRETNNTKELIPYIDKCIELKCKLIKIHPFGDGNGRSIRAFINLLFKIANIPLVYIKNSEKYEYTQAMHLAVNEQDFSYIKTFYYYKICDSIIELDINYNEDKFQQKDVENSSSKRL